MGYARIIDAMAVNYWHKFIPLQNLVGRREVFCVDRIDVKV